MGSGGSAPKPDPIRMEARGMFNQAGGQLGQAMYNTVGMGDFTRGMQNAVSFYHGLPNSLPITASRDFNLQMLQDPMRFTDPLFLQQQEQLRGQLTEQGRRMGGLYSTGTGDLVSQGLGDFSNQYLNSAYQRQAQAAQQLYAQQLGLGQAMFTPYQAFSGPLMGFYGGGNASTPGVPGDNNWGQFLGTAATIGAAAAANSDVNRKHTVTHIGDDAVLERFLSIPVYEWSYLGESVRHMGPMAQDFRAAFGLGQSDREIFLIDAIGVLMGSVKALAAKVEALEKSNDRDV